MSVSFLSRELSGKDKEKVGGIVRKNARTFAKRSSSPVCAISSAHVNTATFAAVACLIVPVCGGGVSFVCR